MTGYGPGRDGEIEALIVDGYLESLLARRPLEAVDVPDDVRATAELLVTGLPRFHPSFRFEEYLAARLATTASAETGKLLDFPSRGDRDVLLPEERFAPIRPAVIGGVLTSAAISLAGAAFVAWRRSHPAGSRMTRAVRAVARERTA